MRKVILYFALAMMFVSCKQTKYITTYEQFQNTIQAVQTELETDGFQLNGHQYLTGTEVNNVVTYNFRNGVSVSVPNKNVIYRDIYSFQNERESFQYSVSYKLEEVWGRYVCVNNVCVENCTGSTPSIFENYCDKIEQVSNPPTTKIERVNQAPICAAFVGGFIVIVSAISFGR